MEYGVYYASKRSGTEHEEDIIGGESHCAICGYIASAPQTRIVMMWHADSFYDL